MKRYFWLILVIALCSLFPDSLKSGSSKKEKQADSRKKANTHEKDVPKQSTAKNIYRGTMLDNIRMRDDLAKNKISEFADISISACIQTPGTTDYRVFDLFTAEEETSIKRIAKVDRETIAEAVKYIIINEIFLKELARLEVIARLASIFGPPSRKEELSYYNDFFERKRLMPLDTNNTYARNTFVASWIVPSQKLLARRLTLNAK